MSDKSFIEFENQIRSIDWNNAIQLSKDAETNPKAMMCEIAVNVALEVLARYVDQSHS